MGLYDTRPAGQTVPLAYPGDPDGDVVARVRGVGRELGVEDRCRVGDAAQAGHPGHDAVVNAGSAVAPYEGDGDPDVRVDVRLDLDDVRLWHRRVRTDGGDGTRYGGVDGAARARPDVQGARPRPLPAGGVHDVVVDALGRLPARDEAEERVLGEVVPAGDHRDQPLALGVVAEARQARRADGRGDADPGGLRQDRVRGRVVRVDGDRLLRGPGGLRLHQLGKDQGQAPEAHQAYRHEAPPAVDASVALGLTGLAQLREVADGSLPGTGLSPGRPDGTGAPTPGARRRLAPLPNILGLLSVYPSHTGRGLYRGVRRL